MIDVFNVVDYINPGLDVVLSLSQQQQHSENDFLGVVYLELVHAAFGHVPHPSRHVHTQSVSKSNVQDSQPDEQDSLFKRDQLVDVRIVSPVGFDLFVPVGARVLVRHKEGG